MLKDKFLNVNFPLKLSGASIAGYIMTASQHLKIFSKYPYLKFQGTKFIQISANPRTVLKVLLLHVCVSNICKF